MQDTLQQFFQGDPAHGLLSMVLSFIVYIALGLVPATAAIYLLYLLLTLPMRRNERARMILDGLEVGLRQGQTPEGAIINIAGSRDRSFGARFYLLAEHLRAGKALSAGLVLVPRLLPPQVVAMLHAGERIGDLSKVLPACRQVLRDGVSQVRGALNYVILVAFVASPALVLVPLVFNIKVLPKYQEVLINLSGAQLPALTRVIISQSGLFTAVQMATLLFIWLALLAYLGGPRLRNWVNRLLPSVPDRLDLCLPWRRKRAQRDFSSVLSLLLDNGVPEHEAVKLAAEATGNSAIVRKATTITDALRQGVKLPEALRALDDQGELQWRVSNAVHGGGGFARALTGWHETLDAKAFQLEQSAAQITTTVLVLINGFVVACFVIGLFMALVQLINGAPLW